MKKVTAEQVNDLFIKTFFTQPRRINLKIHSHAHEADFEKRKESQEINTQHYKDMEEKFQS